MAEGVEGQEKTASATPSGPRGPRGADGRKSDCPSESEKKERSEPDSGDFCMLNVTYAAMHADCAATLRQRQMIEHFRCVRQHKFGTSLEYPVEIFGRNRTLIFSTTTLLGGLRVRSSATASLNCLALASSFACSNSPGALHKGGVGIRRTKRIASACP